MIRFTFAWHGAAESVSGALTSRGLTGRLVHVDARIDERLINNVRCREGAADIRYDAARHTYGIGPRRG